VKDPSVSCAPAPATLTQADALPGDMTGREVLAMYARWASVRVRGGAGGCLYVCVCVLAVGAVWAGGKATHEEP